MGITQEHIDLAKEFYAKFDCVVFPQPQVARIIQASQTDLNVWRKRGHLRIGWSKNGRVAYSGRGVVHAGIMNSLAWAVTPEVAGRLSQNLLNWVGDYADQVRRGDKPWETDQIFCVKPHLLMIDPTTLIYSDGLPDHNTPGPRLEPWLIDKVKDELLLGPRFTVPIHQYLFTWAVGMMWPQR